MRLLRLLTTLTGRRLLTVLIGTACATALVASTTGTRSSDAATTAYVPAKLLASAQASPDRRYRIILQGSGLQGETGVVSALRARGASVARPLHTIEGASATVTGRQLLSLASAQGVAAISLDRPVRLTGGVDAFSSTQQWPYAVKVQADWNRVSKGKLPSPPAIAVVDSGIQANRADFASGRNVLAQVSMVNTGTPNAAGDGYGHGTFVAGIADGSAKGYAGTLPNAPLVSLDVLDDQGMGLTSDVIAACDWIVQNRVKYNIRVANFSLQSSAPASVFWDPLDAAVEKLWFDGVTVVASSGNYGVDGRPSGVLYAPGNDPFVITVGADDIEGSVNPHDDTAAPWSSYGYTYDGFAKPEISAPGRYLVGPAPAGSTLATTRPEDAVTPGYMRLSGTSFAAPVVSGAAAYVLALHPKWTPDQVKGAIMLSAQREPSAASMSLGVGLVDVQAAGEVPHPPNPNQALDRFVHSGSNGSPVFDTAAWQTAALKNPNWDASTWNAAAWGSAAWGSAAWGSAAWGSAAWGSAAWGSAAWGSSSLAQLLASSDVAWGPDASGSATTADVPPDRP
jgi:serine protease AprX